MAGEVGNSLIDLTGIVTGVIVSSIIGIPTLGYFLYKNRDKLRKRKKDFYAVIIKKKKPDSQKSFNDKFGNSKPDVQPSVRENMRNIKRMLSVFDLQSPIYNKRLSCGCKAKDKIIVELCQHHKQQYIAMTYDPPEGYYISDDVAL